MRRLAGPVAILATLIAGCNSGPFLGLHTTIPGVGGDPALVVSLDDPEGLVTAMRRSDPVETPNAVDVVPGSNNAYRVTWETNPCANRSNLSIRSLGVGLAIDVRSEQSGEGCSQVAVRRQVILVLNEFLPSNQFHLTQEP